MLSLNLPLKTRAGALGKRKKQTEPNPEERELPCIHVFHASFDSKSLHVVLWLISVSKNVESKETPRHRLG